MPPEISLAVNHCGNQLQSTGTTGGSEGKKGPHFTASSSMATWTHSSAMLNRYFFRLFMIFFMDIQGLTCLLPALYDWVTCFHSLLLIFSHIPFAYLYLFCFSVHHTHIYNFIWELSSLTWLLSWLKVKRIYCFWKRMTNLEVERVQGIEEACSLGRYTRTGQEQKSNWK